MRPFFDAHARRTGPAIITGLLLTVILAASPSPTPSATVAKGLKYLVGKQTKDGYWNAGGEFFRVTTTAHAGIALLMEGSTLKEGAYSENLRRAVAWFESIARPNGLLVPAEDRNENGRTIQSHAPALLFLASAYDVDDDGPRRERLGKLLAAAVRYAADAQTSRGGWGLVRAQDGSNYDESQQTIPVLHALLTAERAGIAVPRETVAKALKYLTDATNPDGGVVFSLVTGPPRGNDGQPLPTAAAAAALVGSGHRSARFPQWVTYGARFVRVPPATPAPAAGRANSYVLLQHLALARVANALGDDGHRTLDPRAGTHLRWSAYRGELFAFLKATQSAEGNWADSYIGTNYNTALALTILQLDNNYLPAFSR